MKHASMQASTEARPACTIGKAHSQASLPGMPALCYTAEQILALTIDLVSPASVVAQVLNGLHRKTTCLLLAAKQLRG